MFIFSKPGFNSTGTVNLQMFKFRKGRNQRSKCQQPLDHQKRKRIPEDHLSSVQLSSVQLSSVAQSCPTLCDPMNCSTPGLSVHHQLPEFTQTYVHWVSDAIQPSHSLSSPSLAFNLSPDQGLFKWVISSHQVAKVLEFQPHHQSFQWICRTDFL